MAADVLAARQRVASGAGARQDHRSLVCGSAGAGCGLGARGLAGACAWRVLRPPCATGRGRCRRRGAGRAPGAGTARHKGRRAKKSRPRTRPKKNPPPPDPPEGDPEQDFCRKSRRTANCKTRSSKRRWPPYRRAAGAAGQWRTAARPAAQRRAQRRLSASRLRGPPLGARRGEPHSGARLHLIATLRAAAPWQRLRRQLAGPGGPRCWCGRRLPHQAFCAAPQHDHHLCARRLGFVGAVPAQRSQGRGGTAAGRVLCAARPGGGDHLPGQGAELLLPPTRSLVRAKRGLAGLPGGGGTPLAAGIWRPLCWWISVRRAGTTPVLVLLTDGRANVGLDGQGGRVQAAQDALAAARRLRALGWPHTAHRHLGACRTGRAGPGPGHGRSLPGAAAGRRRALSRCRARPVADSLAACPPTGRTGRQPLCARRVGMRWHVQVLGGQSMRLPAGRAAAARHRRIHPLVARHWRRCWPGSYQVVVPDLPGHAYTSRPTQTPGAVLRHGGRRGGQLLKADARLAPEVVVGHSAGAAVAARACLDGPLAAAHAGQPERRLAAAGRCGRLAVLADGQVCWRFNPVVPRFFAWHASRARPCCDGCWTAPARPSMTTGRRCTAGWWPTRPTSARCWHDGRMGPAAPGARPAATGASAAPRDRRARPTRCRLLRWPCRWHNGCPAVPSTPCRAWGTWRTRKRPTPWRPCCSA
jgi:hypothetical protein